MKKKTKKAYSTWSNLCFSIEWMKKYKGIPYWITNVSSYALELMMSVFLTYESKLILDTLSLDKPMKTILMILLSICLIPALHKLLRMIHYWLSDFMVCRYQKAVERHIFEIQCGADYDLMENPDHKVLFSQYDDYARNGEPGLLSAVGALLKSVLSILIFGTLLVGLHPMIFFLLVLLAVLQYAIKNPLNRFREKINPQIVANARRFGYSSSISRDYQYAKEVRIYGMSDWLRAINDECLKTHIRWHSAIQNRTVGMGLGVHLMNFFRDGGAYIFLIWRFAGGAIGAGDFVLYFSAITSVSAALNGIADHLVSINKESLRVGEVRKVEQTLSSTRNHGVGLPIPYRAPEIEFHHVSYRYPGAQEDTIRDVSFRVRAGEKIALVGVNGSGKTTLVKLMCGLYLPTKGEIFVNGQPMQAYNIDEYYALFSAVFQEVSLLPYSIACHVAATTSAEKIDRERVARALKSAGLWDKVASLEGGMDALLDKEANDHAIDLSGGEKQKLSLARAIYLARPVLVLDEPTAALDPIAENEMYLRFDATVGEKTAFFISHRLASTHFCDRIFHLNEGRIVEMGTHKELMAAGGRYKEMYDVQSSYYTDNKKEV